MSFNMNLRGAAGSSIGNTQTMAGNKVPKGYQHAQLSQLTPEQHQLFSSLFSHVSPQSYLGRLSGGSKEDFDALEAPALRQFQELQGNTASRFSQGGARRSSGFQNTMNQATQDFASKLQSQRMGYQQQALRDLMEMSQQLLGQRPYEQFLVQNAPKQPSFLSQLGSGLGSGLGMLGGSKFGRLFG